jgi:hypothetical protein
MRIRVMVQNLKSGALHDGNGNLQDRWPQLAERINRERPDVLLLNEAARWEEHSHRQFGRAMRDLDMDFIPPPKTPYPPAILYRQATIGRWDRYDFGNPQKTVHGFVVATWRIPGLKAPLTFAACHVDPDSADRALDECRSVTAHVARYGPFAVIGGDFNFPPGNGPAPAYDRMLKHNLAARTLLQDPALQTPDQPDRRPAWALCKAGYLDVAWHLYQASGDKSLLRRTGHDDRIDRLHVSGPLGPAISNYQRLDKPDDASDHDGVMADIETDSVDQSEVWIYR